MLHWENQILLDDLLKRNIISLDRGRVISSKDIQAIPGDYPVYSSSAQKNGFFGAYGKYDFDEELITWSVDGGGYFFHRPKHRFSVTNVSGILRILKNDKYDYKFLYYILDYQHKNQIFDYVDKAHPSVIKKRYFIPDLPLSEQQTIASILSKTDEAIAETEKLIAKYNRIKTGLMQDLLTKGIDENGNIRSEETHEFKDSPLGRIPKEWDCEYLGSKVGLRGGYAFKSKDFTSQGIQLIRIGNLYNNQLSLDRDPVFLPLEFATLFPNFLLSTGDIILSMTGTAGKRDYGFAVQISSNVQVLLNQRVCKFIFQDSKVNKDYLLNILHAEFYLSKLYESVTGTKQANLNSENILNIHVPFPDIKEQKRIASKIVGVDKTINESKITLEKLSKLKVGLMQDLLSGKVRVSNITPNQSAS